MALPTGDLGPCQVSWGSDDLGPTLGGVVFKEEVHSVDIKEDGHGDTPVDAVFTGRIVTVECKFTRSSLTQLEAMITSSTAGGSNLKVVNTVGDQMFANAEELILKPLVNNTASATTTEWLHVHKTYPVAAVEFGYDNSGQRIINVTFRAFPDDTSGQVGEIWRMGPAS
jgi:hypothetical protein